MTIKGWVENCENGYLRGWFQEGDFFLKKSKKLIVYLRGELFKEVEILERTTSRADLIKVKNAKVFSIDFDVSLFDDQVAIGNISFYIFCDDVKFKLSITTNLLSKSIDVYRRKKERITKVDSNTEGVALGRHSKDGNVVLGSGGTFFLKKGANNLQNLYSDPDVIDVGGWRDIVLHRKREIENSGAKYFQIFIPEKSSYLYWKVPYEAKLGSPGYLKVIESIKENFTLNDCLIDCLGIVCNELDALGMFQEFDTHLTTLGAQKIAKYCLKTIEPSFIFDFSLWGVVFTKAAGDLGGKFIGDGKVVDANVNFKRLYYSGSEEYLDPDLVFTETPEEQNVIGNRRYWKCENAPIKKKVVCFGNSFFERGSASSTLSWWFSRIFTEFHFIWSPDFDDEYVKKEKFDIVVCQTVERFLTKLPKI